MKNLYQLEYRDTEDLIEKLSVIGVRGSLDDTINIVMDLSKELAIYVSVRLFEYFEACSVDSIRELQFRYLRKLQEIAESV